MKENESKPKRDYDKEAEDLKSKMRETLDKFEKFCANIVTADKKEKKAA